MLGFHYFYRNIPHMHSLLIRRWPTQKSRTWLRKLLVWFWTAHERFEVLPFTDKLAEDHL